MLRAFSTAATGMTAQQMMVDVIANNLANINTNGFKKSQIDFQDLMYVKMRQPGSEVASGFKSPGGFEIGSGVRAGATIRVYGNGELESTGRNLDAAILGEGFFQVTMPSGDTYYTRDGALMTDADGKLVTSMGYPIEPAITIASDATSIDIGKDGSVNVTDSSGAITVAGTLTLARFSNPAGLGSEGDNLFAETDASGTAITGTAGESGMGAIQSGFLEKSNVQMVSELVNLITAQRAYEINSRAIRAGDDMLKTANQIVR